MRWLLEMGLEGHSEYGEDVTHVSLLAEPSWCIMAQTLPRPVCWGLLSPQPLHLLDKEIFRKDRSSWEQRKKAEEEQTLNHLLFLGGRKTHLCLVVSAPERLVPQTMLWH